MAGVQDVERRLAELTGRFESDARRYFPAVYGRTTRAVAEALARGRFVDAAWVERWDVAFAEFYFEAVAADQAGRPPALPWQVTFRAADSRDLPPLRYGRLLVLKLAVRGFGVRL